MKRKIVRKKGKFKNQPIGEFKSQLENKAAELLKLAGLEFKYEP